MNKLKIAMPKGRLAKLILNQFNESGLSTTADPKSRVLIQEDECNGFEYMFVKPSDVITYVKEGTCDIGFVGYDTILEEDQDVYQLYDTTLGRCKMVVAGKEDLDLSQKTSLTIATKYPRITRLYLEKSFNKISIVKLYGSVELGPLVGLSDIIVDIYETGSTLKANNLVVKEELFDISTILISNKASFRMKRKTIEGLINTLETRGDSNA